MGEPALPTNDPSWSTAHSNETPTDSGHKTGGYVTNEIPASNMLNWLLNTFNQYIAWAKAAILITLGGQANETLTITSNGIAPTMGQCVLASGGTITHISPVNFNSGRLLLISGTDSQTTIISNGGVGSAAVLTADTLAVVLASAKDKILLQYDGGANKWREVSRTFPTQGSTLNDHVDGRLTLATGVPVTTSDQTAKTTLYFTPYKGNSLSLYNGTSWQKYSLSEISIAVPNVASQMYDAFVYDAGSLGSPNLTLELVAWTNDTARATALALQDGVYVKTGDATRRYVGSFRTTTVSGQTEDSITKRYVWNYYNRVARKMAIWDQAASWNYTTATFRQAHANAANQLDFVCGVAEDQVQAQAITGFSNTNAGVQITVGIGIDSTSTDGSDVRDIGTSSLSGIYPARASLQSTFLGRHFLAWLEYSQAAGTTTMYGTNGTAGQGPGMTGTVLG